MKKLVLVFAFIVTLTALAALLSSTGCKDNGPVDQTVEEAVVEAPQDLTGTEPTSAETPVIEAQPGMEEPEPQSQPVTNEPARVGVPDLTGSSYEAAAAALSSLGFRVSAAEDYSENVAAGLVCSQSPGPGGSASRGSVISLVISLGPALTVCPSCDGAGSAVEEYTCPECGGTGWCYT